MIINPTEITPRARYKLIISSIIIPRPIAWVSSMDRAGRFQTDWAAGRQWLYPHHRHLRDAAGSAAGSK